MIDSSLLSFFGTIIGIDQEKVEELIVTHYKHEQEELESFHLPSKVLCNF